MIPIFDPLSAPYRGLRTSVDPAALPLGYYSEAKNIRHDSGVLKMRSGITEWLNSAITGATFLGGGMWQVGSNVHALVAMRHGASDVRIYRATYTGTWGAYSEVTASAGKYGNTRMTDPGSGYFSFTPVFTPARTLDVIVQNGTDSPRIVQVESGVVTTVTDITPPNEASKTPPLFTAAGHLSVANASVSSTGTSASFTAASTGTPAYWQFTASSTPAIGDVIVFRNTSLTLSLTGSTQVWFLAEGTSDAWFEHCKWELRDASNYYVVHDPANGKDNLIKVPTKTPGLWLYAFPVGEHVVNGSLSAMDGVRLTVQNNGIASGETLSIKTVAASGRVPGGALYCLSYENTGSGAESAGVVIPAKFEGATVPAIWGTTSSPLPEDFYLPIDPLLDYVVKVPLVAPSTTERNKGVDTINVYRRDPGDEQFLFVGADSCAAYSGSWAYDSDYTVSGSINRSTFTDTVYSWAKIPSREAPSAYNQAWPKGYAGIQAGSRAYVGSRKSSSSKVTTVFVSDRDNPYRFRAIADLSRPQYSGTSTDLEGGEEVKAFSAFSSSIIGASGIYCLTDKAVYQIDPLTARKIASTGTSSPFSVDTEQNRLFFLDAEGVVREMSGSMRDMSRYRVDDQFQGQTLKNISGQFFKSRYYCLTSNGILVWSEMLGEWESLDTIPSSIAPKLLVGWNFLGSAKIVYFSDDASIYEYESGASNDGAQIDFALSTGYIHNSTWDRLSLSDPAIVCLDKAAETADCTMTSLSPSVTMSGSTSIDSSSGEAWKRFKQASGHDMAVEGAAIKVRISATLTAPFTLYGLQVKSRGRAGIGQSA